MAQAKRVHDYLRDLKVDYETFEHRAVYTCDEASEHVQIDGGADLKNMFLRNRDRSQYYLVVLAAHKRLDIKLLTKKLGEKKLSFAKAEELQSLLGLEPGSVSVFGVLHDSEAEVRVVIDEDLSQEEYRLTHPNVNTQTLKLKRVDVEKVLDTVACIWSYELLE